MMIPAFAFYLFSSILLFSALMVVIARHSIHSVLFLVLALLNASGLFILLGAEFVAVVLVMVHISAMAVLFLFIVMMLDVDVLPSRKTVRRSIPLVLCMAFVLLFEMITIYSYWRIALGAFDNVNSAILENVPNTQTLGSVLYTRYVFAFQMAGLILLVSLVGSVVLTLRHRPRTKKQNMHTQYLRNSKDVLEIVKVTPKTGI